MSERSQVPSWRLGYQPALDGVRAVAILAVVAMHTGDERLGSGFYGVDVFFVLSGFLITTLLLQEHAAGGRISLRLFWFRRAARLLPALLVLCAIVAAVAAVDAIHSVRPVLNPTSTKTSLVGVGLALGYLVSWALTFSRIPVGALTHTWALGIEFWFYLLWPPVLLAFLRRPRWATRLVVGGAGMAFAYRLVSEQLMSRQHLYFGLDARACSLLGGCALGAVMVGGHRWLLTHARALNWVGLAGAVGVAIAMARPAQRTVDRIAYERYGVVLVTLAAAAAILSVTLLPRSPLARMLATRPLVWVGQRSYGLFLYHYAAILLVAPWSANGRMPLRNGLLALALSFAITSVSYRWIEQPAIRWTRARERRAREPAEPGTLLAPRPAPAGQA